MLDHRRKFPHSMVAMPPSYPLLSVNLGKTRPFRGEEPSAIAKTAANGPVTVGPLGLSGDEQGDPSVHGGPDKAIHHYPHDHYAHWVEFLGPHPLLAGEGAFGENLSTAGLVEDAVCIGDHYRLGTALIAVSQGRQPCWKLDHRFGRKGVLGEVVRSGRSGWYYRVVEDGVVAAGDGLALVERPLPEWNVARVFMLLVAGGHKGDPAAVRSLAGESRLAVNWRNRAARLLGD